MYRFSSGDAGAHIEEQFKGRKKKNNYYIDDGYITRIEEENQDFG